RSLFLARGDGGFAVKADIDDFQLVAARLVDADGGGDQGLDLLHFLGGAGGGGGLALAGRGRGFVAVDRERDGELLDLARLLHRRRGGVGDLVVGRLGVLGAGRADGSGGRGLSAGNIGGVGGACLLSGRVLRLA